MGVFDDVKLEQLDWMTQMTETIDSDLNGVLAKLPDRFVISVQQIIEGGGSSYMSLSVRDIIRNMIKEASGCISLTWHEESILEDCFNFELKGEPEIDLRTHTMTGEINMVKVVQTLSDEKLQKFMGKKGIEAIGRARRDWGREGAPLERLNEILDILGGCNEAMKNRSGNKKVAAIKERLTHIFETNEWRIRDTTLANKVGFWIRGYIFNGNLADLTNLCKLKVMTHNNMPIYSVKEEQ